MERKAGGLIRGHLAARRQDAAAAARRASGARYDQFVAPKSGMSSLISALTNRLPAGSLRLNTQVHSLKRQAPSSIHLAGTPDTAPHSREWIVETATDRQTYDAVICATPVAVTARLVRDLLPQAVPLLEGIPYASSAVVAMIVSRAELTGRTDGFGLIVPHKEGRPTLAISYTSNKYPGRVPEDQILLRIFLGGALQPDMVNLSDAALLQLAGQELREILGWHGKVARWQGVIRWREAMPQYLVGHVERLQQLEQLLASIPTLKLCGAGYAGVGIPQCVRGGRQAAQALLQAAGAPSVQESCS
jgi:oxygen-dependent protoporphyrinogen oxidase